MAFTQVEFLGSKGATLYKVAADNPNPAGSVTQNGFALWYASTSAEQPVAIVSQAFQFNVTTGAALPKPALSDQTVWFIFQDANVIGVVQAYSIDLASQPGKVIFYTQKGQTVAVGPVTAHSAIVRSEFLLYPTVDTFSNP
jgi:hypothetical protein